jgi:two-component system CheB/CheR fusion protein
MLTSLLSKATQMPVAEVKEGMRAEPNHVYIIPPNTTMGILNGDLHLTARREPGSRHMPIDYFLRSLADDQGSGAIGVILSGAATDGTLGLKAIKAEGGITFAQDEKTAKYDGMPRSAIAAGCVDFVLSPEKIARELARIGRHPYLRVSPAEPVPLPAENDSDLRTLFLLLRDATGVDFSYYKYSTLKRRIVRRMVLHKIARLSQYLRHLRENPGELRALYEDILIHVTAFFREPETFQELKDTILPSLLRSKPSGEPIRVWIPGCSTGEEAYSIAMVLLEYLGDRGASVPIQLFGTDISEAAIERARAGTYSESSVAEVSPDRLRRFFLKGNDHEVPAGNVYFCPAGSGQGSSLLSDGSDQLPERAYLHGTGAAQETDGHLSLRPKTHGGSYFGKIGINQRILGSFHAGGTKTQNLFEKTGGDSSGL